VSRDRAPVVVAAVAALVAVAFATAGCTDAEPTTMATATPTVTPTPTPVPAPPSPCELVTAAEAATALGLAAPPVPSLDTAQECLYPGPGGVDSVDVVLRSEAYTPGLEDAAIAALGADRTTSVPGLGDAAFTYDIGHQVQVHVWAGGHYLLVAVSRAGGGDVAGAARSLTETAVTRLGAA